MEKCEDSIPPQSNGSPHRRVHPDGCDHKLSTCIVPGRRLVRRNEAPPRLASNPQNHTKSGVGKSCPGGFAVTTCTNGIGGESPNPQTQTHCLAAAPARSAPKR